MCIFSVGGGPPTPGSGWDDPVTDGIEDILGKDIFDGCKDANVTDAFLVPKNAAAVPTQ